MCGKHHITFFKSSGDEILIPMWIVPTRKMQFTSVGK